MMEMSSIARRELGEINLGQREMRIIKYYVLETHIPRTQDWTFCIIVES